MRVTDYIANFLARELKCDKVFLVTGGGMMFLSDGVACSNELTAVCTHHEQGAAMAATAYAKFTGSFGSCMITTGCGGTNALTGLLHAWQDGARVFFISGQVKRKQTIRNSGVALRQFGVQEADIISIVSSITKYSVMVNDPSEIAYHLEKAKFLSETGHPGPVWLDIPMDVQAAAIDENSLRHFQPEPVAKQESEIDAFLELLDRKLSTAKRPVVLAGQGIDLSRTGCVFREFVQRHQLPVVTSFLGGNSIPPVHPNYIGRVGTKGTRAGNLTLQNADFLLVLGCRLSVSSTGHEFDTFAREAEVMVVDTDPTVYEKNTVRIDHFCQCDLRDFFAKTAAVRTVAPHEWLDQTKHWLNKYPACFAGREDDKAGISFYGFLDKLSDEFANYPGSAVVSDAGSSFYAVTQAMRFNDRQRYITSGGQAEMGFSLPGAIGAAAALREPGARVAAITGDGSLQMNIQELQTLKHHGFPVKLFVWNNNGYLSIRATQRKFFNGRFIGTDPACGVSFPDLQKLADAYGVKYFRISRLAECDTILPEIMNGAEPVICEVMCDPDQEIIPSVISMRLEDGTMKSLPLEDMYPLLPWEEFESEMCIAPLKRS